MQAFDFSWNDLSIEKDNVVSALYLPKVKMVDGVYFPMYELTMNNGMVARVDAEIYEAN